MINDVNFIELDGEIRMVLDHGGSRVRHVVPEQMAIKLLRQLGEIFSARAEKGKNEALGHAVEQQGGS
jgi:hypothetical protein